MQNPSVWFESMTINQSPLPTLGVLSISQFTPNTGGVTFDTQAPSPRMDLIPRGQRGSFATIGFNSNTAKPTNIQVAVVTLALREGTSQTYTLNAPNNLVVVPSNNYDVTRATLQILQTADGQPARNVEIVVFACGPGS